MIRLPLAACFVAASLFPLASRAGAQNVIGATSIKSWSWDGPNATSSFAAAETGFYTPDGRTRKSALVLSGNDLLFSYYPAVYHAVSLVATQATGMVTLREPGVQDLFLVAGMGRPRVGVVKADRSYLLLPVLDVAWEHATKLTSHYDPGLLGHWVGGVGGDRRTLLVGQVQSAGTAGTMFTRVLSELIRGVHFLDWDHDGAIEVAVVTDHEVYVYEADGSPSSMHDIQIDTLVTTVLRGEPSGDRLACAGHENGKAYVTLVDKFGRDPLVEVDAAALQATSAGVIPRGLQARDVDGDGDEDLLLTQSGSHLDVIFLNRFLENAPTAFGSSPQLLLGETGSNWVDPLVNVCPGVWDDMDGDGKFDYLRCLDDTEEVRIYFSAAGQVPTLSADLLLQLDAAYYTGSTLELDIAEAGQSQTYSHLLAVIWHQANPTIPVAPPIDNPAVAHLAIDLAGLEATANGFCVPLPIEPATKLNLVYWPDRDHYYVELRYLNETSGEVSPAKVFSVTMEPTPTGGSIQYNYLDRLNGGGGKVDVKEKDREEVIGIVYTEKDPPPFGNDEVPHTGPQTPQ